MSGPHRYATAMAQCRTCGRERAITDERGSRLLLAAERECRSCASRRARAAIGERGWDVDWAVVERLVAGSPVRSNPAERREAVIKLARRGLPNHVIAELLHTTRRSVERLQKTIREQQAAA